MNDRLTELPEAPGQEAEVQSGTHPGVRRRRRWRLSIRTLMLLVLVFGSLLGWYGGRVREQRLTVAAIHKAGGEVGYDWQVASSPNVADLVKSTGDRPRALWGRVEWPKWLVDLVGIDAFGSVDKVWFAPGQGEITESLLAQIGRLRGLETLWIERSVDASLLVHLRDLSRLRVLELWKAHGPASDLSWLEGKTRLEMLHLGRIPVRDEDLVHLRPLVNLQSVALRSPNITDAGLAHLAGLTHLESLILKDASIHGEGLAHLGRMRSLETLAILRSPIETLDHLPAIPIKVLVLPFTAIDDRGLSRVTSMSTLDHVILDGTRITDAGLEALMNQQSLDQLDLNGTLITASAAATFQAKRPRCNVRYGPVQSSPYFTMP